jgi:hypothetical protein
MQQIGSQPTKDGLTFELISVLQSLFSGQATFDRLLDGWSASAPVQAEAYPYVNHYVFQ